MPYSSGTFSRVHDFTDDRDNGIRIQASRMDAEMDGIATGLSTALLKDGTQTATAKIPFAVGLSVIDNQTILLGTNSDIAIQYDETTNDSLEISANVEGAALGIVLKSDQGDDNADQHKLSIADGGTLTLGSKISGSFVSYLTHTPNSTVASSTLAVAGNLTVGGNLTLGSGAELSEAELEMLDGITAGTVAASKAVVVDANKDIASFRNVTLTGELDAATGDFSGNVDVDGTLEADAMTLNGTAITATATLDTGISNNNVPKFTSGVADDDFLRVNGTAIEGRSASEVLSDIGGQASLTFGISNTNAVKIDSSSVADDEYARFTANGLESRSTSEVLSDIGGQAALTFGISDTNIPIFTSGVADDDFLRVNGTSIEGRSASEVFSDIGASPAEGSSNIVTTGALNSGSITSGFGNIDTGSSTITTTGVGTFGSLDISGDIDVDGTTNLDVVDIDGALTQDGGAVFNEGSADVDFRVESNGNANMLFVDGGNDRVGIGTNLPQKLLHLKDGDIVVGNGTASNNAVIGRIGFSTDASNSRFIGIESFRGSDAANGDLRFHTFGGDSDSGERVRIHTNGVLSASDGIALGVGTANTASNVLSDYEEGTFTPTWNGYSPAGTTGRYTKIGRQVMVYTELITGGSTDTSEVQIDNLPFTVSGSLGGGTVYHNTTGLYPYTPLTLMTANSTVCKLKTVVGSGNEVGVKYNDGSSQPTLGGSATLRWSIFYETS